MGEETKVICGVCKLAKNPDEVLSGQAVRAADFIGISFSSELAADGLSHR